MSALLRIADLRVSYGPVAAVNGVSLSLGAGELGVVLGANGAGKTTIIKTVMGLLRPRGGGITFDGAHDLVGLRPHLIHRLGVAWVPEGRQLWNTMSVLDNLRMGAFDATDKALVARRIAAGPPQRRPSPPCSPASRACASGATSSPARSAAASSRWWRSPARSSAGRACC